MHSFFFITYGLLGGFMKKIVWFLIGIFFFFPFHTWAEELIPNADSGILMEVSSGKILYEKDIHKRVSVASMTKMVAQILILEEIEKGTIHWNDIVTVSSNASEMGGSQIYLEAGEKMSVEDLMKGISVASGNDATVAMAEYISGTEEKFVKRMNQKVLDLGLADTHFENCTGLDQENHYSSSYDMAMIARELMIHHPDILKYSSIYEDYLRQNTDHKFWLVNTNKLIAQYEGCDGLKTGHTDAAGYCLAATAKRGDLRFIAIVLGEKDSKVRNRETVGLLDYGFTNTKVHVLKKKGEIVDTISFSKATPSQASFLLQDNLIAVEEVGESSSYHYKPIIRSLSLPIQKGSIVGEMIAYRDQEEISRVPIVVDRDVQKMSFLSLFWQEIKNIFLGIFAF